MPGNLDHPVLGPPGKAGWERGAPEAHKGVDCRQTSQNPPLCLEVRFFVFSVGGTSLCGLYCPRVHYSNVACWMQADAKHRTVLFAGAQQQGEALRPIAVQRFQAHRHTVDRAWRSPRRRGRDKASPIGSESRIAAQSSSTLNRLHWRCAKVALHQCHFCRSSC